MGKSSHLTQLKRMEKLAKIVAENPRIPLGELKKELGHGVQYDTKRIKEFMESPVYKMVVDTGKIKDALEEFGDKTTYLALKPVTKILLSELWARLMDDELRGDIPTKVILEFLQKFGSVEATQGKQGTKEKEESAEDILKSMKEAVRNPRMVGKSLNKLQ